MPPSSRKTLSVTVISAPSLPRMASLVVPSNRQRSTTRRPALTNIAGCVAAGTRQSVTSATPPTT